MLFLDVNVCVSALRPDASERAAAVREWLEPRLLGHESVGVSEYVLASTMRIATNHRVFAVPSTPAQAATFATTLLAAPMSTPVRPGPRHWPIFAELVTRHRLRGNDIADGYLASLAMEQGATFVTLDKGFNRFDGLRVVSPL